MASELSMMVSELTRSMSNQEFVEWGAYYGRKAQREELAMKKMKKP